MTHGAKHKEIPDIEGSLYLYDSPPDMESPDETKMVNFSSPNYAWSDGVRKEASRMELYFSFWTDDELLDANKSLDKGLSDKEIKYRFSFFGSVARCCLGQDQSYVDKERKRIELKVVEIDILNDLEVLLKMEANTSAISLNVFHFIPRTSDSSALPWTYETVISSK